MATGENCRLPSGMVIRNGKRKKFDREICFCRPNENGPGLEAVCTLRKSATRTKATAKKLRRLEKIRQESSGDMTPAELAKLLRRIDNLQQALKNWVTALRSTGAVTALGLSTELPFLYYTDYNEVTVYRISTVWRIWRIFYLLLFKGGGMTVPIVVVRLLANIQWGLWVKIKIKKIKETWDWVGRGIAIAHNNIIRIADYVWHYVYLNQSGVVRDNHFAIALRTFTLHFSRNEVLQKRTSE